MSLIKTFITTCLLIIVLQIELNQQTLESHLHQWLQKSPIAENIKEIANGAVSVSRDIFQKTEKNIKEHFSKEDKSPNKAQKATRI